MLTLIIYQSFSFLILGNSKGWRGESVAMFDAPPAAAAAAAAANILAKSSFFLLAINLEGMRGSPLETFERLLPLSILV